jgi:hypothetical protein
MGEPAGVILIEKGAGAAAAAEREMRKLENVCR